MENEVARITVLNSGLTVITHHIKGAPSTDIAIKILAGSRDEVASNVPRGTAHFDEHMVCAGSANYPGRARELIEGVPDFDKSKMGHHFTPATVFYFTNYYASIPTASTNTVLDIMCDIISHPNFDERDVEIQKKFITNERISNQLSFRSSNFESLVVPYVAHGESPLLYPIIGDKNSIQEISATHLKHFHSTNVTTNRTVIAVEGDVSHDAIVKIVEKSIALPSGPRLPGEVPIYTGGDTRYSLPGDGGAHIVLAFKAPPEGDFRAGIAFKIASRLLTAEAGKHSIPAALSSDQLGVYQYATYPLQMVDWGLLIIAFNAMEVQPCLEAIQKKLFDLSRNVDAEALAQVRVEQEKHIKSTHTLLKTGVADMAWDFFLHGKVLVPDHYSRLGLEITEEEIKNAVREMLSYPPTFVAAGDLKPLMSPTEVRNLFFNGSEINDARSSLTLVRKPALQRYAFG